MSETLLERVMRHEGFTAKPKPDAKGAWEIGYGHDITAREAATVFQEGVDEAEARDWLVEDLEDCLEEVQGALAWLGELSLPRQEVLVEMCYQMGLDGLLAFHATLAACEAGDFAAAAADMRASEWHRETPARCEELAQIMESGTAT